MANTHAQARASIDLGAGLANSPLTGNRNKIVRNHPPRLQHSPSLPNIWFPPHSGPIPSRMEDSNHEPPERPVSPTPTIAQQPSITSSLTPKKVSEHRETLSFDDLTNYINKRPLKLHMRRRMDHDHGYSLLTPPLTPSSSLRTATSIGSSNNAEAAYDAGVESQGTEHETSPAATHFLLLGNISKTTPSDTLRSSIVGSLTTLYVDPRSDVSSTVSVPNNSARFGPLNEDSIKGVFVRCQKSHGIVMLAFFDIRHAAVAKTILSTPSPNSPLVECIGDDTTEAEIKPWISCQFVTADELAKTIGNSTFLASVDGRFYISVEGKETPGSAEKGELRVVDDRNMDERNVVAHHAVETENNDELVNAKREINLTMLKSMLDSFGILKSFSTVESESDTEAHTKIFHIEYYDVREANAAYTALDGQVLFGMKLKVFGRETSTDQSQYSSENKQGCSSPTFNEHSKNVIPFPNTTAATFNTGDGALQIGPPGHHSQTRERFFYPPPTHHRPRSVSAGQHVLSNSFPQPPSFVPSHGHPIPSPTYFYTSSPAENQTMIQYPQNFQGQRAANQFFVDHTGRPYAPPSPSQVNTFKDTTHSSSFEALETTSNTMAHQDPGLQYYGPHHDCYYCPSRSIPNTSDRYYAAYSTPSPLYYPRSAQVLTACYSAAPSPVPPSIHMRIPEYEYENSNTQPVGPPSNVVTTNWAFESAMMTASHPATGDNWYPESNGVAVQHHQSVPHYSQPTSMPTGGPSPYHSNLSKPEPQIVAEHYVQTPLPTIFRPNIPSAPSPVPVRLTHPVQRLSAANPRELPVTPERNQLNLVKIEDGQDTRTTVMVKNIPNKMSDKDLIAYIGKVCPRKIDFLYLRMDFQNGCNVGYAFVNFINVQDLLFFAKKKLGEKWNMFSSEKVLQMSYANYQGKEALVEKFKNSCIMDEREAWRPKIFYSNPGPEQGLPEPFPAPTHLRRKERSSFNRGALYVPGIIRGCPTPQINTSIPLRRQQQNEEQRSQHGRHVDRERQNTPDTAALTFPTVGTSRRRPNSKTWGTS